MMPADGQWQPDRKLLWTIAKGLAAGAGAATVLVCLMLMFRGNTARFHRGDEFHSFKIVTFGLRLYIALFGLSVVFLEAKTLLPEHSELRRWFYTEFHFLSRPRGKGLYYMLLSYLLFLNNNIWLVLAGLVIFSVGCVYLTASFIDVKRKLGISASAFRTSTSRAGRKTKKVNDQEYAELPVVDEEEPGFDDYSLYEGDHKTPYDAPPSYNLKPRVEVGHSILKTPGEPSEGTPYRAHFSPEEHAQRPSPPAETYQRQASVAPRHGNAPLPHFENPNEIRIPAHMLDPQRVPPDLTTYAGFLRT